MNKEVFGLALAVSLSLASSTSTLAKPADATDSKSAAHSAPIPNATLKGVEYLVSQQNTDGSWSQGEESQYMRSVGQKNGDIHNVADTCMAAMALIAAGNLPNSGKLGDNVARAANYVCDSIEKSDEKSLFITEVRGTRVQFKLGQFVDTFLAATFLPQVKGHMNSPDGNERVVTALRKVVHKIELNQGPDGKFANGGWAPIHSQSLALQGLNRAAQAGVEVSPKTLAIANEYAQKSFDGKSNSFGSEGSASVPLYSASATIGALQSSVSARPTIMEHYAHLAASPAASKAKLDEAKLAMNEYANSERVQKQALEAVKNKLSDSRFVSGFGCNGGEEFLSYLQISQSLLANKSPDFADWNKNISSNLYKVQQTDGSWMGQHCITSRTFCTATAVQVLLADRANPTKSIASANPQK